MENNRSESWLIAMQEMLFHTAHQDGKLDISKLNEYQMHILNLIFIKAREDGKISPSTYALAQAGVEYGWLHRDRMLKTNHMTMKAISRKKCFVFRSTNDKFPNDNLNWFIYEDSIEEAWKRVGRKLANPPRPESYTSITFVGIKKLGFIHKNRGQTRFFIDREEVMSDDLIMVTYTFDEFVAYGISTGSNVHNGFPWSFKFCDISVTHETDELYLLNTLNETIHFAKGDTISVKKNGTVVVNHKSQQNEKA